MAKPVGVWIALVYLVLLLALAGIVLIVPLPLASAILTVPIQTGNRVLAVLAFVPTIAAFVLGSIVLLWLLRRWAVVTTGVVAALTAVGFYLSGVPTEVTALHAAANFVANSFGFNLLALIYLAGTAAVFVYTAWLWRRGVLT
jgi:hypothetical protein